MKLKKYPIATENDFAYIKNYLATRDNITLNRVLGIDKNTLYIGYDHIIKQMNKHLVIEDLLKLIKRTLLKIIHHKKARKSILHHSLLNHLRSFFSAFVVADKKGLSVFELIKLLMTRLPSAKLVDDNKLIEESRTLRKYMKQYNRGMTEIISSALSDLCDKNDILDYQSYQLERDLKGFSFEQRYSIRQAVEQARNHAKQHPATLFFSVDPKLLDDIEVEGFIRVSCDSLNGCHESTIKKVEAIAQRKLFLGTRLHFIKEELSTTDLRYFNLFTLYSPSAVLPTAKTLDINPPPSLIASDTKKSSDVSITNLESSQSISAHKGADAMLVIDLSKVDSIAENTPTPRSARKVLSSPARKPSRGNSFRKEEWTTPSKLAKVMAESNTTYASSPRTRQQIVKDEEKAHNLFPPRPTEHYFLNMAISCMT